MILVDVEIEHNESDGPTTHVESVAFYTDPAEITMRRWVDFTLQLDGQSEWLKEFNELEKKEADEAVAKWSNGQWAEYLYFIAESTSNFSSHDLPEILQMKLGEIQSGETEVSPETGGTLLVLYQRIVKGLTDYKPQPRDSFTHKGVHYKVRSAEPTAFDEFSPGGDVRVIEAIQALQSEHVFTGKDEEGNPLLSDPLYQTSLAVLAAFSQKVLPDGSLEMMPLDLVAAERFLQKRMKELEDITMDVALDVYFFLTSSKLLSRNTRLFNIYSMLTRQALSKLSS